MKATGGAAVVLAELDAVRGRQEDFYRDLYSHPELPHEERRTAANVATRLGDAGCEGIRGTGVVGVLRNGDGPTVLVRADMDAGFRHHFGLDEFSIRDIDKYLWMVAKERRAART